MVAHDRSDESAAFDRVGSVMGLFSAGETWSSFCGVSQSTFEEHLAAALDDAGYDYERRDGEGSFMLGREPSGIYAVGTPDGEATITVLFASGDPMLRFLSSFRTDGDASLGDVCVVKVAFDGAVEPHVRELLSRAAASLPRHPADVGHHPRFRLAPLARWRIRRQWRRWVDPS